MRTTIATVALFAVVTAGCGGSAAVPRADTSTPRPTEEAVASIDQPVANSGVIEFGKSYDDDTLKIKEPTTRWKRTWKGNIAWVAHFSEPAGATTITLVISSKSKGGAESVKYTLDVDIADPSFDTVANTAELPVLVDRKAGTYVLRYLHEATVLAEGEFTLVK